MFLTYCSKICPVLDSLILSSAALIHLGEMQGLWPTESEAAFKLDPQVIHRHSKV